jgi:hypothetical protein
MVDAATLAPRPASSPWIPPMQDRELVAQDQDFGGLPGLLTPG